MITRYTVVVLIGFSVLCAPGNCDVVVIANRSRVPVQWRVVTEGSVSGEHALRPGEVMPLPTDGKVTIEYRPSHRQRPIRYRLDANCSYYFGDVADGTIQLAKIGLGGDEQTAQGRRLAGALVLNRGEAIGVKILVDEDEPAKRRVWEDRLRRRIRIASRVLEKYCRLRLDVVAVGTWKSDDRVNDFGASLKEFERQVAPSPARLAIGFTSQYQIPDGRTHLGGTRGPLASHILIREWSQHIPEPQRVELLLHEIGHFLGAAHSPERRSVMRPLLLDRHTRGEDHSIQFDPVNTLVMYLVTEELRARKVTKFSDVTSGTKQRLRQIYGVLAQTSPQDPVARKYAELLRAKPKLVANPLLPATRQVVFAVVQRAAELREGQADSTGGPQGDQLTEQYVRAAARAAQQQGPKIGPSALILGLGITLDDSNVLQWHAKTKDFVRNVEKPAERSARIELVGKPTMRGRRDLTKHFVVSAYLTVVVGSRAAEAAGMVKEIADAQGNSGFSFADMAANQAGIVFAGGVLKGKISLEQLARDFVVEDYLPDIAALEEGIAWDDFRKQFPTIPNGRYHQVIQDIRRSVVMLPPYRNLASNDSPATPAERPQGIEEKP